MGWVDMGGVDGVGWMGWGGMVGWWDRMVGCNGGKGWWGGLVRRLMGGVLWFCVVWCGVVWCGVVWCGVRCVVWCVCAPCGGGVGVEWDGGGVGERGDCYVIAMLLLCDCDVIAM